MFATSSKSFAGAFEIGPSRNIARASDVKLVDSVRRLRGYEKLNKEERIATVAAVAAVHLGRTNSMQSSQIAHSAGKYVPMSKWEVGVLALLAAGAVSGTAYGLYKLARSAE